MSSNKYGYVVTDVNKVEKQAKNAVETIKRVSRGAVTKMLDVGVVVEGIEVYSGPDGFMESYQGAKCSPPAEEVPDGPFHKENPA